MIVNYGIFIILFTLIGTIAGSDNCYLNKTVNDLMIYKVNDISRGQIDQIETRNVTKVDLESKYVTANYENDLLTFTLTDEFAHFIENENNVKVDSRLALTCTKGDKTIILELVVNETIHHGPKFSAPTYSFKIAMPLFANKPIEGTDIAATDLDLAQRNILFEVTGDYSNMFDFVKPTFSTHNYQTSLMTKKSVDLKDNATFIVTVTDVDGNTNAEQATVNIIVDSDNSIIPNPEFASPYYRTKYSDQQDVIDLDITLVNNAYVPTVQIIGDYTEYFEASKSSEKLLINKIKDLPDSIINANYYIILIMQATYDGADRPGKTVILMDLSEKDVTTTTVIPTTTCPPCTTLAPPTTCAPCPTCSPCTTIPTTPLPTTPPPTCPPCTTLAPPTTCAPCPTCSPYTTIPTTSPKTTPSTPTTPSPPTTPAPTCAPCPPCTTTPTTLTTPTTISTKPTTSCPVPTCPPCPTTTPITTERTTTTHKTTTDPNVNVNYDEKDKNTEYSKNSIFTGYVGEIKAHTNSKEQIHYEIKAINDDIWDDIIYNFEGKFYIIQSIPAGTYKITIRAWIGNSEDTATVTLTVTQPKVSYKDEDKYKEISKFSDFTGLLATIQATADDDLPINYKISDVQGNEIKNKLLYSAEGKLYIIEAIPPAIYMLTLKASIQNAEDTAKVNLTILNTPTNFKYGLLITDVDEKHRKLVVPFKSDDYKLNIVDKFPPDKDWFDIDDSGLWVNNVDREDPAIASMHLSQINVTIESIPRKAESSRKFLNQSVLLQKGSHKPIFDSDGSCLYTKSAENIPNKMNVVVIINDINDHSPELQINQKPFFVGYPSKDLTDFVGPKYLARITATDKDFGINAFIKYKINTKKFIVDPHSGIIVPGRDAFENDEDAEFTYTAQDRDGEGLTDVTSVKVKILKEEHLLVVHVKNLVYNNISSYLQELQKKINKDVRYLTSTALFDDGENPESKKGRSETDDNGSVVKIVLYALDNSELIKAKDLKTLIDDSKLSTDAKEYETPRTSYSTSGWIAAVSTLSVVLIVVICGIVFLYIFYLRPKVVSSTEYLKHNKSEPTQTSPVKSKIKSTLSSGRRPTGIHLDFNPDAFEVSDSMDGEMMNEKNNFDRDEGLPDSTSVSSNEPEARKSVVKFNDSVTEIEIEKL